MVEHEDRATAAVEQQTSRIPSLAFMGFAVAAMATSAALVMTGRMKLGNFVGQWAPTILIMGLYNKVAKEISAPRRERMQGGASTGAQSGMSMMMGHGAGV